METIDEKYLEEIPDYGDHMTMEEFEEYCFDGGFMDDDGCGYYATKNAMSKNTVNPSDVILYMHDKNWSHVVWFNK